MLCLQLQFMGLHPGADLVHVARDLELGPRVSHPLPYSTQKNLKSDQHESKSVRERKISKGEEEMLSLSLSLFQIKKVKGRSILNDKTMKL